MYFQELERYKLRDLLVVAIKEQMSSDMGEETVILNLKTGVYHSLNAVGTRIWSLLQEAKTANDILDVIVNEYEVERDCCERDLLMLLQELANEKLIEVKHETAT